MRSYLHSGQCHNPTNSTNYYLSQGHGVGEARDHAEGSKAAPALLRPSSPPTSARRPFFSFPFPAAPRRAAPEDPAQHPAPRLLPARPESYGDQRRRRRPGVTAGVLYVSHRSEEKRRCPARKAAPSTARGERVASPLEKRKWAAKAQSDTNWFWTAPERQRAALQRFAR